jgi:hypothetical protein
MFSRDYSDEQKAEGREVAHQQIRALLSCSLGLMYLDDNKLIYLQDPEFLKSIQSVLEHELGFQEELSVPQSIDETW